MKEQDQAPVGQEDSASGESAKTKDSVSYDSYQKLLKEKKSVLSKYSELENQVAQLRQEKDMAEGNKDKVIEELKKQNQQIKSEYEKTKQTYTWSTLTGEIKREAMKHGCKDPDKLLRLMSDDDLRSLEIGEDFSINSDGLKEIMEKNKKENHFLFESSPKAAAVGVPGKKAPVEPDKNIKDMTIDELRSLYKQTYK
jgi:hypothetical protein